MIVKSIRKITPFLIIPVLICGLISCSKKITPVKLENIAQLSPLERGFVNVPDSIQTSVYWYWMSDNISKEGVVKDLHAMKSQGINRAFIGNIGYPSTPYGKVKLFSAEWWDILHTALKTATELNIEIGIFNSPGWSQSGGPWIKPSQSMRYLASSETLVKGGKKVTINLNKPNGDFQDVRVTAFKAPKNYAQDINSLKPKLVSSVAINDLNKLIDGDQNTEIAIPATKQLDLDFITQKDYTARSLVIYPAHKEGMANAELQVKEKDGYRTIKSFKIDRSRANLNVGFDPYGPVAISFPATSGTNFRLVFTKATANFGIAEIVLSATPRVESFTEKTLAKMFQTPLPYWNEYQWKPQAVVDEKDLIIDPTTMVDISDKMNADGTLNWDAPKGDWIVLRSGMLPTKVENGPASPEGVGLEVDKMSKEHVASHFDAFLGEIMRRIPAEDRKTWKVTVEDSYETGGQNWTDGMLAKFKANYGYDALPYLPVIRGEVVGSQEMSDRFLWDLRRFIADRVAYDYVGGLRDISHKYGLHTWLENYGHWGFPGEFLQYGGQSDEIAGEFWSEGELGNIENRAASSAAHIYGKNKVSAESFTAGGKPYIRYPYMMKQRGDRFFTEGINNTLLHVYIEQPSDDKVPGINANFGNEFNRHNTYFNYLNLFTTYLKRSNFMLQQGKYIADAAYFIGEDAPKMTGVTDPALPKGYSFDYINGEVIKGRVKVVNGKLVLPDGMTYSVLVLPKLETMRPELLQKITELVAQGATVLGPAPSRSPSLENYPQADAEIKKMAKNLWGDVDGVNVKSRVYGKGNIMSGMDMQQVFDKLNVLPDFKTEKNDPVLYIHRKSAEADIYFVSNQSEETIALNPTFNVEGKQPEIWDPVTGTTRNLTQFSMSNKGTAIPLKLAPLQSAFIVFRKPISATSGMGENFPEAKTIATISLPWSVTFDQKMRGPKNPVIFNELIDWTKSANDSIKYYSGTAVYQNTFNVSERKTDERVYLNLTDVKVMAKLKVNGVDVGGVWTAPWRVDITNAVKKGKNTVEISVVNTWVNRLIGDSKLPEAERKTWTSYPLYSPDSPLQPAGLTGPVTVTTIKY
ncbi:glycoside hydrolase family 2 [Pedobacter changchengzhani]|uniref:Glycoside hydrolase family 2 n=1 Tax=Pedobacter changchengzhani TaxID=2529274 RepID=A0A4R5MKS9_9SPHI|nr:glycosyl hydrolase [Pedobacter changchengzhani]TDG36182.1 glycoside hydrolase family 2 [Pedobacter changchengzhani]